MNKIMLIATLIVLIFSVSEDLSAQRRGQGRRMHMEDEHRHHRGMRNYGCYGNYEHMKDHLKLTDEQMATIGKINSKYKNNLLEHWEKIRPKRSGLRRLLLSEKIDFNRVRSLLKEISDIEIEMRILRIKHRLEIEKVLTIAQRKRLRQERKPNWK